MFITEVLDELCRRFTEVLDRCSKQCAVVEFEAFVERFCGAVTESGDLRTQIGQCALPLSAGRRTGTGDPRPARARDGHAET